ncbi:MAG: RNA methyltransferase [Ruminococcaceae bacterium]|nr:RNA methyltransferase [Oscillospiraceae bacterium]
MYIDSTSNKIVKHTKKLFERSGRKEYGQFIIEGRRLVSDAISAGADIEYVITEQGVDFPVTGISCYELSAKAFSSLKTTVNSQGILGVVNMGEDKEFVIPDEGRCFYIYLDGISDPGNMGTIIRTGDACGADGVILSKNCVDVYNPKVVRSTMSGIFNIPLYFDDEDRSLVRKMQEKGISIISGSLDGQKSVYDVDFKGRCAVVIGNEANGITEQMLSMSDELIKIPILGKAESLNAAVACAVISYEALRQNL